MVRDFIDKLGSIIIRKYDQDTNLLLGAHFTISPNPKHGGVGDPLVVIDNGSNDENGSDGIIEITGCNIGSTIYTVTETVAPPGYDLASPSHQDTTIPSSTIVYVDFHNTPLPGKIIILKKDATDFHIVHEPGFTVTIYPDPTGALGNTDTLTVYDNPTSTPPDTWQSGFGYILNDLVRPITDNGRDYKCTRAGTSGGTEPSWTTGIGDTIDDPDLLGVEWTCQARTGNDPNDKDSTWGTIELDNVTIGTTYTITEIAAPAGYMINPSPMEANLESPAGPVTVVSYDYPPPVPTLSQWGIIAMAGAFGILLIWTGKRRLARKNS